MNLLLFTRPHSQYSRKTLAENPQPLEASKSRGWGGFVGGVGSVGAWVRGCVGGVGGVGSVGP